MTRPRLADAPWLADPSVAALFDALEGGDAEIRFVGGAVRDALLGRQVADIDFATTLPPMEISRRLAAAGLKAAPTGLAHGTVTAVIEGRGFEITTLRQDVETDGRHAVVAFTDDWRVDAARRDFTINAMSASRDGAVYDYFDGAADLAAGCVRFVGVAADRVREDYLRILRFFRFHAWYGAGAVDAEGLAACKGGVEGLAQVSSERLRVEILRLLAAPDPTTTLAAMATADVLPTLFGAEARDIAPLIAVERSVGAAPNPILRLAALAPSRAGFLAERLRLSRAEASTLAGLAPPWSDLGANVGDWRRALHRLGLATFRARSLLAASVGETEYLCRRLQACEDWTPHRLPVNGRDLIKLGLTHGPEVGAMLHALEEYWLKRDFSPNRDELIQEARQRIGGTHTHD